MADFYHRGGNGPTTAGDAVVTATVTALSFFFLLGYSLGGFGSGRVRALNLTVPLGSGRVGSDNLGYGPGSGFSFEPVQTSNSHQESSIVHLLWSGPKAKKYTL